MDILFDLDGTLIDPQAGIVASITAALHGLGRPVPPRDELLSAIGPPLRTSFPRFGVAAADVETALQLYRARYDGSDGTAPAAMYDCALYPGIATALDTLRHAGCRLIVATSKPHVFARPILRHLGLAPVFAAIHGAELDGTRDDKTALIAHICAGEDVDPATAVMVGDRAFDVVGATANGLRSIGATWGYGTVTELRDAGASALCPDPHGIPRLALWMLTGQS